MREHAGEERPGAGAAGREREGEEGDQEKARVPHAARAGDERVGVSAGPEQAVEERLVDEVRQQASRDEPPRGQSVAQTTEEPGADPDVA